MAAAVSIAAPVARAQLWTLATAPALLLLLLHCSHSTTGCTACSPGSWQCDLLDGGGALLCSGMPISAINNNGHKWERERGRKRDTVERDTVQTVAARDMKTEILCGL